MKSDYTGSSYIIAMYYRIEFVALQNNDKWLYVQTIELVTL